MHHNLKTRNLCPINRVKTIILSHSRNSMRRTVIKLTLTRVVAIHRKPTIRPQRSSWHKFKKVKANLSLRILTLIRCPNASHCKSAQKRLTITPSWSKTRNWLGMNWRPRMAQSPARKKLRTRVSRRRNPRKRQESHLCHLLVQAKMMNLWKSDNRKFEDNWLFICTNTPHILFNFHSN